MKLTGCQTESVCVCVRVCVCRRKSQQAEREYEKVKHQLENLEESVRDRCKKEFTGVCVCVCVCVINRASLWVHLV